MKRRAPTKNLPRQIEMQSDQPVIRSSLERFVLAVDRGDPGVTAYAGPALAMEAFAALGLGKACQKELVLKQRQRGPTEAQWVEMFVMLHLAGGQGLEDVEVLKQDDGLVRLWPAIKKMSPRSALDFLLRFHDDDQEPSIPGQAVIRPATPGLEGLRRVNVHLLRQVQEHHLVQTATLDLDASIHACDKKAALRTYEGPRGYQPVIVYKGERPFPYLAIRLPPKPRQLELFEPPSATEEYVVVVTNPGAPGR